MKIFCAVEIILLLLIDLFIIYISALDNSGAILTSQYAKVSHSGPVSNLSQGRSNSGVFDWTKRINSNRQIDADTGQMTGRASYSNNYASTNIVKPHSYRTNKVQPNNSGNKQIVYPVYTSNGYSTIDHSQLSESESIGEVQDVDRYHPRPYFYDIGSNKDKNPPQAITSPPQIYATPPPQDSKPPPRPTYLGPLAPVVIPPTPDAVSGPTLGPDSAPVQDDDSNISYTPPPGYNGENQESDQLKDSYTSALEDSQKPVPYKPPQEFNDDNKNIDDTKDSYASALDDIKKPDMDDSSPDTNINDPYNSPIDSYKPPAAGFGSDNPSYSPDDMYPPNQQTDTKPMMPQYVPYNSGGVLSHSGYIYGPPTEAVMKPAMKPPQRPMLKPMPKPMPPPMPQSMPPPMPQSMLPSMPQSMPPPMPHPMPQPMPNSNIKITTSLPEYLDYNPHSAQHDHHYEDYHHIYHEVTHPPSTTPAMMTDQEEKRVNTKPYSYYYLGRKLWYIPLYFSVYFICYIFALIVKSITRHKVQIPNNYNFINTQSGRRARNEEIERSAEVVNEGINRAMKRYAM